MMRSAGFAPDIVLSLMAKTARCYHQCRRDAQLCQGGGDRLSLGRFAVKASLFHFLLLDLMEPMLHAVSSFWPLLRKGVALVFILVVVKTGVFKLRSFGTWITNGWILFTYLRVF